PRRFQDLDPPTFVPPLGVATCPVHQSSLGVPDIFAPNLHWDSRPQRDSFRKIDVVADEKRRPVVSLDQEPLMPRSLLVVGEKLNNRSARFEKKARLLLLECFQNGQLAGLGLGG